MTTNARFLSMATGSVVHVVTTKAKDLKESKCVSVKKGHNENKWGRQKGISPEAALALGECSRCQTHSVAKQVIESAKSPEEKRAEAKERARDTMDKMKTGKTKPAPKTKVAKTGVTKTRTRAASPMEAMVEKATMHLEVAKEFGWKCDLIQSPAEVKVEATKHEELLRLIYADGRITHARVTLHTGVEVKLRNSANWLRYAKGELKVKGNPVGRKSSKTKSKQEAEENEQKAERKLPFHIDDDDDVIIKSLGGLEITWRNFTSGGLEVARVPARSRNVRISVHPKSGKKMISFHELHGIHPEYGEQLGGERVVLLERILRAK